MSPIGTPDFGANPATNPTSPSFDPGEDTTRLLMGGGSQARSGRWIFATGFEEGSSPFFQSSSSGSGGEATIKNDLTYQGVGTFSLKAGNAVNDFSYLQKTFLYPSSRYGVEFVFSRIYAASCELHVTMLAGGKGESNNKARVGKIVIEIIAGGSPAVEIYWDVNGTRTPIMDASNYIGANPYLWHYFKFVFDFDTNKIPRFFLDNINTSPNFIGYEYTSIISTTSIEIKVINKTAGTNPNFYFDNLIITADEP